MSIFFAITGLFLAIRIYPLTGQTTEEKMLRLLFYACFTYSFWVFLLACKEMPRFGGGSLG